MPSLELSFPENAKVLFAEAEEAAKGEVRRLQAPCGEVRKFLRGKLLLREFVTK